MPVNWIFYNQHQHEAAQLKILLILLHSEVLEEYEKWDLKIRLEKLCTWLLFSPS